MNKLEVTMFHVVFLKTMAIAAFSKSADTAMLHQTSEKILDVLDNLFIALKIDQNYSKSKNVEEYMTKHSVVQDALCNNYKKYKQIHDISKTNISHKIAYYISNINEVVDEMIRTENVTSTQLGNVLNVSNCPLSESQNFIKLARRFNLTINAIATTTSKLPSANGSRDEARRIFEGRNTDMKQYPFMVSVHVAGRFVCAGSLLHESLALSAASCLMRSADMNPDIQIRVASDYVSKMGYLMNIQETIFHPQFDRSSLANNLVILRTRKALRFIEQRVVSIKYDRSALSALTPAVPDIVILGWGRRKTTGAADLLEKDRPLSEAQLQLYDFNACQYIYTRNFVGDKTFCAGFVDRGAGACNHDAGGPALIANVLVGVISFGSPKCGAAEAPTVFTRVGAYDYWIDSIFQKLIEDPETSLKQQTNTSKNIARTEIMNLDEEMKDVYRENYIDDGGVLYGPIEAVYDNEMANISHKSYFPELPSMFPNPELVAPVNISKSKTLKSAEVSDGYWRDYSSEDTRVSNEYYIPANKLSTTKTMAAISTNHNDEKQYQVYGIEEVKNLYKYDVKITTPKEASLKGNYFDTKHNDITTNSIENYKVNYALIEKESIRNSPKTSIVPVLRENPNGYGADDGSEQTNLIGHSEIQELQVNQSVADAINETESNEKAIVFLVDSGTTQRVDVQKDDPVYQKGFKLLADRVHQAQVLAV